MNSMLIQFTFDSAGKDSMKVFKGKALWGRWEAFVGSNAIGGQTAQKFTQEQQTDAIHKAGMSII